MGTAQLIYVVSWLHMHQDAEQSQICALRNELCT